MAVADVEKRAAAEGGGGKEEEEEEEEEERLLDGMAILDFDMLCSTVAMQTHHGKWGLLNEDDGEDDALNGYRNGGERGGGVLRMWEGELLYDCFDDLRIALQSSFCPCYRFGKNMRRAGFGSCFLQGSVYMVLVLIGLLSMLAFIVTKRRCFLYIALSFIISIALYLGYHRTKIRKKFNIKDSDSALDDCVFHLVCPCCSLSQESRTLEMNNVQDGIWHGRGDTICVGMSSEASKTFFELHPPPLMVVQSPSPEPNSLSESIKDIDHPELC